MEFTIRKMQKNDIQQVQQVAKKSWNTTYKGIIPLAIQENFLSSAYNDDMMQKRLKVSFLYVSEVEGKIIGFANFSPVKEGGEAELGAIYLYPEYQRKGIGTALLQEGINNLKDVKKVFINVEKDNTIGTKFYEAKGFGVVSEFDDNLNGHITKMLRMVLEV
jgi:ribosomal protein S18 acetylase RimI-like enzyme